MTLREELVRRWWVADPFRPTEDALRYYEIKHRIAASLNPRSICEIGVRAGYSAYAFLSAAPAAEYVGIDWGTAWAGSAGEMNVDLAEASACCINAEAILKEFAGARIAWVDSQTLSGLPRTVGGASFEFVHVDADHTYRGCAHDLALAALEARWILVDDFDVGPDVRAACRDFLLADAEWMAEYIPDGFRGNLLLSRLRLAL